MAQQEVNLEQSDFSAGFLSDVNPLQFPPNATVEEYNFEISPDGSRSRRRGLKLEPFGTPSTFYRNARVSSVVYSTISPNPSVEQTYTSRKKDLVTTTSVTGTGTYELFSYDADSDGLNSLPYNITKPGGPHLVTKHTTSQAVVGVNSNKYVLSLIYGWNGSTLGMSTPINVTYGSTSATPGTPVDSGDNRIADLTSWSGRMVYAFNTSDASSGKAIGISALPDPNASVANQRLKLSRCEQTQSGDLLGTDGAWIYAGDLGAIQRVVPYRTGLLIFTDENIWYLNAPAGYFNPYEFTFDKISDTKVSGKNSIIVMDNRIFFWAESGMYVIHPDENTGLPKLQNISEGKVQKWYEALLPAARQSARGVYNREKNECRWMYTSRSVYLENALFAQKYDKEIILSLSNGAHTFSEFPVGDNTYVMDYIPDNAVNETFDEAFVVVGNQNVTVGVNGPPVYVENLTYFEYTSSYKYVVRDGGGTNTKLAALTDQGFVDFKGSTSFVDGVDAAAVMKSGWFTFNGVDRRKTPNWVTVTMETTETGYDSVDDKLLNPSGCLLTSYWDYADDNYTGKVHGPYQVYRLNRMYFPETTEWNYGQQFISTKNKIRGRGRTLQFKFETEANKDCRLYAWGYNGNVLMRV